MNYSKELVKDYVKASKEILKERFAKLAIDKPEKDNNFLQINNWSGDSDDSKMYLSQIIKDCEFYGIKYDIWNSHTTKGIVVDASNYAPPRWGKNYNPVPTINVSTGFVSTYCLNDFNDVEGATVGSRYVPAVAKGMIDFIHLGLCEEVHDQNVLIIGRGHTMGSRLMRGFLKHHANVMVTHSRTSRDQLESMIRIADIVVTATSVPEHITTEYFEGVLGDHAILIDAGTCFNSEGKLVGNCTSDCYEMINKSIGVPGGVGPLTRLALFQNIFRTMDEIGVVENKNMD